MADFVLRVKTKSGQKVVNGLSSSKTVAELKRKLSELTGIDINALEVRSGFPPKVLNLSCLNSTLSDTGIVSGDTLIVEEKINLCNGEKESRSHVVDSERFSDTPGMLMKKIVPADNSCLFTSVGYVLNGKVDPTCSDFMREIIATAVASNPEEYSEAILGKPNSVYCEWILKADSWGGAIELSILSKFFGLEIAVVNSVSGIINRFGEDQHYAQRVFLIFDGIHYDPLYLEPHDGGSIQTIFPTNDERVLLEAGELAKEAKSSRQYTDVQNFTVKCLVCNIHLGGQTAASQHAKETGHMNFGEIA
ncbi:ubiquitin thioesterase OTU1 [Diachasma alloeum]|uniref:ubiquitin thioesterase OTU1 n=1 Tax=Diachasma alloeum TaxID=454923 RepID=UPI0007384D20|nr:ubiquitin thioesterase OTU1 [Diachasma alloeum]